MQDVDEWASDLSVGDSTTATDTRDGKTYSVARLADGNIWMTQNLDLNLSSDRALTSDDTDLNTVSSYTPETTSSTLEWASSYEIYPRQSYDPGDKCVANGTASSLTDCSKDSTYHIGNYYNYASAIAYDEHAESVSYFIEHLYYEYHTLADLHHGLINNGILTEQEYSTIITALADSSDSDILTALLEYAEVASTAKNSICPKGWRLAGQEYADVYDYLEHRNTSNYGINFSFRNLRNATGITPQNITSSPFYATLGGRPDSTGAAIEGLGSFGAIWGATPYFPKTSFYVAGRVLYYSSSETTVHPHSDLGVVTGVSVRCAARETTSYVLSYDDSALLSQTKTSTTGSASFIISSKSPADTHVGTFLGWTDDDKTLYRSGDTITITENTTLYPVYKTLQTIDIWGSELSTNETVSVPDSRDGKFYTIAKLADGNIWMTENLRLDGNRTLTPLDSDVTKNFSMSANSSEWHESYSNQYIWANNGTDSNGYYYGYHYNYVAATAGTGQSVTSGSASDSICPRGWQLPTATGNGSFETLISRTTSSSNASVVYSAITSSQLKFSLTGLSSTYNANGYYWTNTSSSATEAYSLDFASSGTYPNYPNGKTRGYAVRCVAR